MKIFANSNGVLNTHIDDEGSVADFFGVLWRPTARIASPPALT